MDDSTVTLATSTVMTIATKLIIPEQTPNSMGRNTWTGKLQALLLLN